MFYTSKYPPDYVLLLNVWIPFLSPIIIYSDFYVKYLPHIKFYICMITLKYLATIILPLATLTPLHSNADEFIYNFSFNVWLCFPVK